MKPPLEYRAPKGKPAAKAGGRWVFVRDDQIITKRPQRRAYMRAYMVAYRKKAKKACG